MAANIIVMLSEDTMFIKLNGMHLLGRYLCMNKNSNNGRSIYLKVVFITMIVACIVATNHGQLLFMVRSLPSKYSNIYGHNFLFLHKHVSLFLI